MGRQVTVTSATGVPRSRCGRAGVWVEYPFSGPFQVWCRQVVPKYLPGSEPWNLCLAFLRRPTQEEVIANKVSSPWDGAGLNSYNKGPYSETKRIS